MKDRKYVRKHIFIGIAGALILGWIAPPLLSAANDVLVFGGVVAAGIGLGLIINSGVKIYPIINRKS